MAKRKTARAKTAKRGAKKSTRSARAAKGTKGGLRTLRPRAGQSARKAPRAAKRAAKLGSAKRTTAPRSTKPAATRASAQKTPPSKAAAKAPPRKAAAKVAVKAKRAPSLDRARRTVAESEMVPMPPSSLNLDRSASAARTGRAELNEKLHEHTSTGPALTAGDVDADWESAESVGDEAPGGDNPTPDQDVVDDIGKALGVEYDDDEELQGGDEIVERDKKRWELDPASSDDFDDRD